MIKFSVNEKGRDIVRFRKLEQSEFPEGMTLLEGCRGFVDLMAVYKDGTVSTYDVTPLTNYFEMTFMEFKLELGKWLYENKLDNGDWIRIKMSKSE